MSASHHQHAHNCCHASRQHGPDTATGETTTSPGFTVIASEKEPGPQDKKKG